MVEIIISVLRTYFDFGANQNKKNAAWIFQFFKAKMYQEPYRVMDPKIHTAKVSYSQLSGS